MSNKTKGLYNKYNVTRTDGSDSPGGKHHECEYFVLDITHDPFAKPALLAYAEACKAEYPALANDLLVKAGAKVPRNGALAYFLSKHIYDAVYIPKESFDLHVKKGLFSDGPFRDSFGDGPGEPYNPNRQVFGVNKHGGGIFTELSEK